MNVSSNILARNQNFKKLRHGFVHERALITTKLISFCHWKTLVPLSLQKKKNWKRISNTNSELSQNRTEKQIIPFKRILNWLFNDIWCYLVIGCFDWKIGVFVLRGLLHLIDLFDSMCKFYNSFKQTFPFLCASTSCVTSELAIRGWLWKFHRITRSFYKKNFYKQCQAEIGKISSKTSATPWGWTLAVWNLFAFFIHIIIQK